MLVSIRIPQKLEAEMDETLGYGKYDVTDKTNDNSINGCSKKTIKTELVPVEINIPRDRNGEFKPKIVPKHQMSINGIEDKILSLYATGMTTRDISDQIKELYGVDISAETVSNITNRILPLVADLKGVYTANVIESLNSQFRKVTKTKLIFPNDDSLIKMLYLAVERVSKKWVRAYSDWDLVIDQLNIIFSDI